MCCGQLLPKDIPYRKQAKLDHYKTATIILWSRSEATGALSGKPVFVGREDATVFD